MTPSNPSLASGLPWLILGSALTFLVGWEPNLLIAIWFVPLFLMRFARHAPRLWQSTVGLWLSLTVVGWFTVAGAWHMGAVTEIFFSGVMAIPLTVAATVDRLLFKKLSPVARTLVFPSVWTLFDFLYSFIYGLGDVFSPALTQFHNAPLLQLVSLTGIYGVTFMIGWFASTAVTLWDDANNLDAWKTPVLVYAAALTAVLAYGSARLTGFDHDVATVRVASIVVPHQADYFEEIVDEGSLSREADRWRSELQVLEDEVFAQSLKAVESGAQIVFWSETATVMYEDHEAAYLARGARFAKAHNVYLQTSALVIRFDDEMIDNQITLFTPEGEIGYRYLKTQTWYPTESDGVIPSYDTPYGRISSVICFDLDVPGWMRGVAKLDAAILLVPGFDTLPISPYHTETGLFRAVEGGYSIVRAVNKGTSMSVDSRGRVLALQDSFRTNERIMYTDVPTESHTTVYGRVGDWFPMLTGVLLLVLVGRGVVECGPPRLSGSP